MNISLLKMFSEVTPYVDTVQTIADKNKRELGFLAKTAYEQQANQGRLWIAVSSDTGDYIGHLMFGGRFPNLKVFQMFVLPIYRGKGVAAEVIDELAKYGERFNFLSISARVAEDLPANAFWEKCGFVTVKKVAGGKTTKRIINIKSRELNTPSLLKLMRGDIFRGHESVCYVERPTITNPVYVLDVNVVLDLVRSRSHRKEASCIMRAAFNNKIRISVTAEFLKELERSSKDLNNDPLLEFAKELPVLSNPLAAPDSNLMKDLRKVVFPERDTSGKKANQDHSDLLHLAYAILNGADGFITRESAILRAKEYVSTKYGLEILSPVDLFDSTEREEQILPTCVVSNETSLHIFEPGATDISEISDILANELSGKNDLNKLISFGVSGAPVRRLCIRNGPRLIGFAAWDSPSNVTADCSFFFFIDENDPGAERTIDHIFETVFRAGTPQHFRRITLRTGLANEFIKATAMLRGFRALDSRNDTLVKLSWSGIVTTENWKDFGYDFFKLSGLKLPPIIPDIKNDNEESIELNDPKNQKNWKVSVFQFETLISPGMVLYPGREGLLVPIRPQYAAELEVINPLQLSLLPKKEASLYLEKAYFRKNQGANNYKKGKPVVFYISRTSPDSKSAVGCGRITYSSAVTLDEAVSKLSRQGVLDRAELSAIADKNGLVHAFTYDNFNSFINRVSRKRLKELGAIGGANLVTAEKLEFDKLKSLLTAAF
jgi:GNAT superfamily N-acetyltransferase/predicted nucleic acid-binding protein